MNTFTLILAALLIALLLVFFIRRMFRRNEKAIAGVTTPSGYTEDRIDQDFVVLTFKTKSGKVITQEYYFDKNVYNSPHDFQRLFPTVTIKYELKNPENFVVFEKGEGDYTQLIACVLIGLVIASVASSQQETNFPEQLKTFAIWFFVTSGIAYLIIKISPYFSFLNILTRREED